MKCPICERDFTDVTLFQVSTLAKKVRNRIYKKYPKITQLCCVCLFDYEGTHTLESTENLYCEVNCEALCPIHKYSPDICCINFRQCCFLCVEEDYPVNEQWQKTIDDYQNKHEVE